MDSGSNRGIDPDGQSIKLTIDFKNIPKFIFITNDKN